MELSRLFGSLCMDVFGKLLKNLISTAVFNSKYFIYIL